MNAVVATTTTAELSRSPTSFKMTCNTRIIFGAGIEVGAENGGARVMAMSKMNVGGRGGGGRGRGLWGDRGTMMTTPGGGTSTKTTAAAESESKSE